MPQPKRQSSPSPPASRPRLSVVPATGQTPCQPISQRDAERLLDRLAEQAEAQGDAELAQRYRGYRDRVVPGYVFEAFLSYRVE